MTLDLILRLGVFFGLFAMLALWERAAPLRPAQLSTARRWGTNWGLAALDSATVRVIFGAAAVGAAMDATARGWGLGPALGWPDWLYGVLVFLVLDLAIWAQHVVTHRVPLLWRLHRVHHSDRDFDVSTAIRFHPIEIALSMALKIGLVYALGAPPLAVLVFEVVLNGSAMFNHANISLPPRVEQALRWAIVTPDMHRVHHSVLRAEHDRNFGFCLSLWDRLFGTYLAAPAAGQRGMTIGLADQQTDGPARLGWSLMYPFRD